MAREFWKSSGYHLVERDRRGWLSVTPDLLRAYFTRPEIHPVDDSCDAEHRLFDHIMADPFAPVTDDMVAAVIDPDAAENYRIILAFRDHLARHGTLEAAYRAFFSDASIAVPPVFIDQLATLILRNILRNVPDPMRIRAAELFFREQAVTTQDEQLMLADAEIVETYSDTAGFGGLGALLVESGTPLREVSLDILDEDNKELYWQRSDRFDTAIDFRFTQPALDGFCRVLEAWIGHFTDLIVRVQPVQSIRDERWVWHVGLDSESTRILNGLYQGDAVDDAHLTHIVALFKMDIEDQHQVMESVRGRPIWMGLAMTDANKLKMKPQNLLTNLPLTQAQ